jgi:hypothetical protein
LHQADRSPDADVTCFAFASMLKIIGDAKVVNIFGIFDLDFVVECNNVNARKM